MMPKPRNALSSLFCVYILSSLFLSACGGVPKARSIRKIVVEKNTKTTKDTVLYLADMEEGDEWKEEMAEKAKVELVSSGLFKEVEVSSKPHPDGGFIVTILAKDKHSWVIAPTVYNQPTNKGGGVGFGENNLFGENKKLLLYGQIATGDSFLIAAYIDPSIAGSRFHWAFDLFLQNERVIEYAIPQKFLDSPDPVRRTKLRYLNGGAKFGATVFRSLSLDGRLRGAYVYYGKPSLIDDATLADVGVADGEAIPVPGEEGWDVSGQVILKLDGLANWYGITSGNRYELKLEKAFPGLGSDFDYKQASAHYVRARKYFDRHNLVLKSFIGIGKNVPFQHERTAGGTSLRGYKGAQFRGDFGAGLNLEYSVHMFSIPFPLLERLAVRGLVFGDSRYTTFLDIESSDTFRNYLPGAADQSGLAPWKNSVGLGTRFFARSIVLPLLGLDVGYGIESGAFEVYFAIGLTDV